MSYHLNTCLYSIQIVLHGKYLPIPHGSMAERRKLWVNCESHVLQLSESNKQKKDNQKAPQNTIPNEDKQLHLIIHELPLAFHQCMKVVTVFKVSNVLIIGKYSAIRWVGAGM